MLFIHFRDAGARAVYSGTPGAAVLRATDRPELWSLHLFNGKRPRLERGVGEANVTASARSEDLALMLWGRRGREVLDVEGDEPLASEFVSWLTL